MSRPLRLHIPGLLYHIVARGNEKACIFTDEQDYEVFLTLLADAVGRFRVRCAAYCLLWNHYHLLLAPGEHPISRAMQQLNSTYCQRFNRRHGRVGHVLQGRFGSRIVEDGAYARAVVRYIALNPVAAGRVTEPHQWRWSSYRFTVSAATPPEFLALGEVWKAFGTDDAAVGRTRVAEHVRGGLQEVLDDPLFHGSPRLARRLAPELEPHQATRDFVFAQRFAARPPLGTLFAGRRNRVQMQDAARTAFSCHGYTLAEIGALVGREPTTIWRWIRRAAARRVGAIGGAEFSMSTGEYESEKIKI